VTAGRLHVVATPIGNIGDLAPRARAVLAAAALIACEDTRRTGRLLELAGVERRARLLRLDAHTEARAVDRILAALGRGDDVALVSDAGTPGVSDPGTPVVAAAAAAGHPVVAVPGPSAALAALTVSGLPTDRFTVEGFLPRRGAARAERLAQIASAPLTSVVFESPHRLLALLDGLVARCGPGRRVAICRELTKLHEETWRGELGGAAEAVGEPRGEYVVVVEAAWPEAVEDALVIDALHRHLAQGRTRRDAAQAVAAELGVAPNRVKRLAATGGAGTDG